MELAILKQGEEELNLIEFSEKNITDVMQDIVNGNLKYIALKDLYKKLPRQLKSINIVVNVDGIKDNNCVPNLLINDDFIMGNIIFINLKTVKRKKVITSLSPEQVVYVCDLINECKIYDIIKEILE